MTVSTHNEENEEKTHNINHNILLKIDKYYDFGENFIFNDFDIFITRFNSLTLNELQRYKEKEGKNEYSIYGCSRKINTVSNIERKLLWVLEMNNTLNQIVGIGFINNIVSNTSHCVYSNDKYNQIYYASPFHLNFIDGSCILTEKEKNFIHFEFERSVFYGKSNLKRGQNISKYPDARLKKKHLMFLLKLYISRNPSNVYEKVISKRVKI